MVREPNPPAERDIDRLTASGYGTELWTGYGIARPADIYTLRFDIKSAMPSYPPAKGKQLKKSLYDILQVSKLAGQDAIDAAYWQLLQELSLDGSQEAQNQIKCIRHVHGILSDPVQKALYDNRLQDKEHPLRPAAPQHQRDVADSFDVWLKSSRVIWIIAAWAALIGFGLFTGHRGERSRVEIIKPFEINEREALKPKAAKDARYFDNGGRWVKDVDGNQGGYADAAATAGNRDIDTEQQAEAKLRSKIEYRVNAGARLLEIQRREREDRLKKQGKEQPGSIVLPAAKSAFLFM